MLVNKGREGLKSITSLASVPMFVPKELTMIFMSEPLYMQTFLSNKILHRVETLSYVIFEQQCVIWVTVECEKF